MILNQNKCLTEHIVSPMPMNTETYYMERALAANEELLAAVKQLLPQLSSKEHPMDLELLKTILESQDTFLFLLRRKEDRKVAGMITLGTYLLLTGRKWWVEDVVVDEKHRGQGLGHLMLQHVRGEVARMGGGGLLLTSRPSRVAANALYQSEGYVRRETNVYKLEVAVES